jgi:uncharacterized membrane protein
MRVSARTEIPQLALLAVMFLLAAWTWPKATDHIPVHWNAVGQVDRYGGKVEGLLLVPLLAVAIYFLLLVLPRFDPGRANYAQFSGTYTLIRFAVLALMAFVYVITILPIHGRAVDVATLVPVAVGALFILLGSVMGKLRPNWFVGIRTPWTLSSKQSWVRTHRVGGWLFILMGLAFIVIAFIRTQWAFMVVMALVLASVVVMTVYSYLVWRNDPEKSSPAGTLPVE